MNNEDYPSYVRFLKRHYGAFLHLLWYIATETADRGADIAARALALLAPLPNAVSVFFVSQHNLGFGPVQAFAFAAAVEISLFAIIEVALHMWDGILGSRKRYNIPLAIAIVASLGVLSIIVAVVYSLEVSAGGHWVLALLPFISLFAFVSLGLKRWHERNLAEAHSASAQKQHNRAQQRTVQDSASAVQPDALPAVQSKQQVAQQMKANGFSHARIAADLGVHRNTVGAWLKHTNGHSKEAA